MCAENGGSTGPLASHSTHSASELAATRTSFRSAVGSGLSGSLVSIASLAETTSPMLSHSTYSDFTSGGSSAPHRCQRTRVVAAFVPIAQWLVKSPP